MNLKNIYIRGFSMDEWDILRAKRLEAIKENPGYFLRSYEDTVAFDENYWRGMILQASGKVFGLFDGWKAIGLTGIFKAPYDDTGTAAEIGMSYIDPPYRGRGLSRLLYDVRVDWAKAHGFKYIVAAHRDGNDISKRALLSAGFNWIGSKEKVYGDGQTAISHTYEMNL